LLSAVKWFLGSKFPYLGWRSADFSQGFLSPKMLANILIIVLRFIWEQPFLTVAQKPGANPTIVIYNASAVKIYSAMNSLVHFEDNNIFFGFEKRSSILHSW
jgi:hypothetical protein